MRRRPRAVPRRRRVPGLAVGRVAEPSVGSFAAFAAAASRGVAAVVSAGRSVAAAVAAARVVGAAAEGIRVRGIVAAATLGGGRVVRAAARQLRTNVKWLNC